MSALLNFYRGWGLDEEGRTIHVVWGLEDLSLEQSHSYIQWLFPLPEPSLAHPSAPVLSPKELSAFRQDAHLQATVRMSLFRMKDFFARTTLWKQPLDHNHLRITRILRSLTLMGLTEEAHNFHAWLLPSAEAVSARTRWYWAEALKEHPAWLNSE